MKNGRPVSYVSRVPPRRAGHLFRGDEGDIAYVETVISAFVILIALVFAVNIFSFFTLKQDIDYFGAELMAAAAADGRTDGAVKERAAELCTELGFDSGDISWSFEGSEFIGSGGRVQYGETIKLTVTYSAGFGGTGIVDIPVTLRSVTSGISERYWKS